MRATPIARNLEKHCYHKDAVEKHYIYGAVL